MSPPLVSLCPFGYLAGCAVFWYSEACSDFCFFVSLLPSGHHCVLFGVRIFGGFRVLRDLMLGYCLYLSIIQW